MVGSIPDSGVHEHFAYSQLEGAKNETAECLRCHKYKKAKNTSRQKQHLLEHCPEYKDWLIANDRTSSIRPAGPRSSLVHGGSNASGGRPNKNRSATRSSIGLGGVANGSISSSSGGGGGLGNDDLGSGLEDFSVQTNFTSAQKRRIDEKLALAMYASAQPFSMFEDPLWLDFFKELGYVPPPRQTLVEICLMRVRSAARGGAPVRPFQGTSNGAVAAAGAAAAAQDRAAMSSTPSQQPQPGQGVPLAAPQYSSSGSAHTTPVATMREPVQTTPVISNAGPEFGMSDY